MLCLLGLKKDTEQGIRLYLYGQRCQCTVHVLRCDQAHIYYIWEEHG
jgi:hypothetical protein